MRLPVTEMGCAGGTSGLIYADQYLRANPGKRVALISVETPSITFQKNDLSMENLVSTAIFADGASCVILEGADSKKSGLNITDTNMYHFPNATHLMGYNLTNTGLKIVLDKDVPDQIESHFPNILHPFLERNEMKAEDVTQYLMHPGGKKIINMVEKTLATFGKDVTDSKAILKEYGNLSSSTILYIIDRYLQNKGRSGDTAFALAFGPGFVAQSILFKWD